VAEGDAVGDNVLLCQLLQPKVVDETS
jgi:hypothetical protein